MQQKFNALILAPNMILSFQKGDKHNTLYRGEKNAKATYSARFGCSHFSSEHNIDISQNNKDKSCIRNKPLLYKIARSQTVVKIIS